MPRALRILVLAGTAAAIPVIVCAAVGWLYLMRGATGVWGPKVGEALPLDELPGHADVSLLQFIVVWLCAGLLLGLLARAARIDRRAAALLFATGTLAMLLAATWLAIYVVRQIPSGAAFHAARHVASVYLAAVLTGAGSLLLRRRVTRSSAAPVPPPTPQELVRRSAASTR